MKGDVFKNLLMPSQKSNRFDFSHDVKTTFNMGELVPTAVMEAIPGDRFTIRPENLLRFAPLISPVMHKVNITTDYFFIPNRILWAEFEDFITGNSDVEAPFVTLGDGLTLGDINVGGLADYMGIPTGNYEGNPLRISPLSFAAYLKVYDEWYRDQNLQTEQFTPLVPGFNPGYESKVSMNCLRRAWMHDYFTACLPFAQKGDAVQIPLTQGSVPVELVNDPGNAQRVRLQDGTPVGGPVDLRSSGGGNLSEALANQDVYIDPNGTLEVDIQADAVDTNTLRTAFRTHEWLEKTARGGSRYIESILSHFGVRSSDARLQRPEFIGRIKQNMVISEVLATAENTEAVVPVGQMAGHGISVGGGKTLTYKAEEHGFVLGIINVQPITAYQDGLHRSFTRFDKFDYAWPTFAHLGEQEVKLKEIAATQTEEDPETTFGYIPRYSEYKYMNSRVSGQMRTTLDFWHLGRKFTPGSPPALNSNFIECRPSNRIFAVTSEDSDHIFAHIINNVTVDRRLPRFGVPTI